MGVGINAPGYHQPTRGVDDPCSPGDLQIETNLLDGLVFNVDVRSLSSILVDDHSSLDEDPDKRIIMTRLDLPPQPTCSESSGDDVGREALLA